MVTLAGLFTIAILPVVVATATFNIAVEKTEDGMKKVATVVMNKVHPPKAESELRYGF